MNSVKIKNLNKSHKTKSFDVKGRIKFLNVYLNKHSSGMHLNCILFDKSSEIEIVAFRNCDDISMKLKTKNVVHIHNASLKEVNKDYKKTKHKYQIVLELRSIITSINNEEVNIDEFPYRKYTPGSCLQSLITGMIIDVIGVCVQFNDSIYSRSPTYRIGKIKVDSTEIEFRLFDEKANEVFDVGCTLSMSCVMYKNFKGSVYLSVGRSSSVVKCDPQLLLNDIDKKPFIQEVLQLQDISSLNIQKLENSKEIYQDLKVESPDQKLLIPSSSNPSNEDLVVESPDRKPSTSSSVISDQNSVIKLPDQRPSISTATSSNENLRVESPDRRLSTSCGSTAYNKRKTRDFDIEEVASKFLKITETDEIFFGIMLNLIAKVNNKDAVKMRILECIHNYIAKEDTNNLSQQS